MKENLLQYLWNYKLFSDFNFIDSLGNEIQILDFGTWNTNAGPDFLMAKIKINGIILVGNIELHVRSSDWIFHQHQKDPNYDHIILHAVYLHDIEIEELKSRKIPTLELKNNISEGLIHKYSKMLDEVTFIPCENVFESQKIPFYFFEGSLLKKLEQKAEELQEDLQRNKNNYEELLFHKIAYAFGLKVNAEIFRQIAESIDFNVIQKIRQNRIQLEALFFGISGWLEAPVDAETLRWKNEYDFLRVKFQLPAVTVRPKFLRLRPPNFPTLRLSQLAHLYHRENNLFSKIMNAQNIKDFHQIFSGITASAYWDSHYNFGKTSTQHHPKQISNEFIELLIINAVLPVKYLYHRDYEEENTEQILALYSQLSAEKNTLMSSWQNLGITAENALQSQSLNYHYQHFCILKKCLHCGIGFKILKEH